MKIGRCPCCKVALHDSDIEYKPTKINTRPPGMQLYATVIICKKCNSIIGWLK
ncbi:hypothetical protein ES702_00571 [subsurface metagenome]